MRYICRDAYMRDVTALAPSVCCDLGIYVLGSLQRGTIVWGATALSQFDPNSTHQHRPSSRPSRLVIARKDCHVYVSTLKLTRTTKWRTTPSLSKVSVHVIYFWKTYINMHPTTPFLETPWSAGAYHIQYTTFKSTEGKHGISKQYPGRGRFRCLLRPAAAFMRHQFDYLHASVKEGFSRSARTDTVPHTGFAPKA